MENTQGDPSSEEKFSYSSLLDALIKPQIIIAFITAIAGPWTIAEVSNDIKEREIQSQIVTKIMELSSQTSSQEDFQKKINFLTTLVGDNEFGLKFPSIPELIENERRIEREDLQRQLANREEEMLRWKAEYDTHMEELARKREELGKTGDKKLKKEISELEQKTLLAGEAYESLESDVRIKRERLDSLSEHVENLMQERVEIEQELSKLLDEKDRDIANLEEKLESMENELKLAREQLEKFEITEDKPDAEKTPGSDGLAKLGEPEAEAH